MTARDPIQDLAALVAANPKILCWRQAVVSVVTSSRPTVRIAGSTVDVGPLPRLASYATPVVGDTVWLLGMRGNWLVIGHVIA